MIDDPKRVTFQVDVGCVMFNCVRNFLLEIKHVHNRPIEWKEGEGWLSRPFWITTDPLTASVITAEFNRIIRAQNEEIEWAEAELKAKKWWQFWR